MAPINLPDGTEVSEVILPDGASASEVIAPDGTTVFGAIPDSVVSHWEFEDEGSTSSAEDSESDNDLDVVGGPAYTTESAVGSHAMDFTGGRGSGDRLTVSNSDGDFDAGDGEFAVSMWVYLRDATEGALWQVHASSSTLYRVFNANDGANSWSWDTDGNTPGNIAYTFPNDTWEHYVFQRNANDEIELYVDSEFEETVTTDTTNLDIGGEWHLGYDDKGSTAWGLDGKIDDVFYFGKALTQSEIDTLYAREA